MLQPIDTAPRDGTRFWGLVGDDLIAMFWHDGFGEFVSSFKRMELAKGYTFDDTGLSYQDYAPAVHRPIAWTEKPELTVSITPRVVP